MYILLANSDYGPILKDLVDLAQLHMPMTGHVAKRHSNVMAGVYIVSYAKYLSYS